MLYPPLDEVCAFEVCVVLCVLLGLGSQALLCIPCVPPNGGELRNVSCVIN